MEYLSIVELAARTGIPGNTLIQYLKQYTAFFSDHKIQDGIKTYPATKLPLINRIHTLASQEDNSVDEITRKLERDFPAEDAADSESHGPSFTPETGRKLDRLAQAIELQGRQMVSLTHAIEALTGALRSLPAMLGPLKSQAGPRDDDRVIDQLLTTRQDDEDDDPELMELFHRSDDTSDTGQDHDSLSFEDQTPDDRVD